MSMSSPSPPWSTNPSSPLSNYPLASVLPFPTTVHKLHLHANKQYENWERVIAHVNAHPDEYKLHLRFATLDQYFRAVHREHQSGKPGHPEQQGKHPEHQQGPPPLTVLEGRDFFPYADNEDSYWTGYYTSKSWFKRLVRTSESRLRNAELLLAQRSLLFGGGNDYDDDTATDFGDDTTIDAMTTTPYDTLVEYRHANAEVQHHDAITGTAKQRVTQSYVDHLGASRSALESVLERVMVQLPHWEEALSSSSLSSSSYSSATTQTRTLKPPVKVVLDRGPLMGLRKGQMVTSLAYNSLAFPLQSNMYSVRGWCVCGGGGGLIGLIS